MMNRESAKILSAAFEVPTITSVCLNLPKLRNRIIHDEDTCRCPSGRHMSQSQTLTCQPEVKTYTSGCFVSVINQLSIPENLQIDTSIMKIGQ